MTNFGPSDSNRRWYDNIDNMTQAIHISRDLPPEIQMLIARSLSEAIDGQRKNRRTDKYAVSLGHNRTLGLHRASYGRRWYDPNPLTRRAFNFMSTVPDAYLAELASRILRVANHVDQQHQALPLFYDHQLLAGEVSGILRQGQVSLRQSDEGIRLTREHTRRFSGF